jgi:hypothetical protein
VHRIAQIFRERGVDISVPHLVRTVRRFVDEEERAAGRSSAPRSPSSPMAKERHPEPGVADETKPKAAVTYQVSEQPSTRVQEEEFAKQLRLARYLAGASLGRPRDIQKAQTTTKQKPRAKAQPGNKKRGSG